MSHLVRKIERGKWLQNDIVNGAPVSADAITNCTRTKNNRISLWNIPNETALAEAVLAMASAADDFDSVDVVVLDEAILTQAGLTIQTSSGLTPVSSLVETHRDIVGLTYPLIGEYSKLIVEEFRANRVQRFRRPQLRNLVKQAIGEGKVSKDDLSDSLKKKLY